MIVGAVQRDGAHSISSPSYQLIRTGKHIIGE
jgi:hypothetical protein